jgi:hypothetical protein
MYYEIVTPAQMTERQARMLVKDSLKYVGMRRKHIVVKLDKYYYGAIQRKEITVSSI